MIVGIGIDVVPHTDVRESWHHWSTDWLAKWCNEAERAHLMSVPDVYDRRVTAIAATLALKEAVTKALAPAPILPWPWHHIHILGDLSNGRRTVTLSGVALGLSQRLRVTMWTLNASHSGDHTLAIAIASSNSRGDPPSATN